MIYGASHALPGIHFARPLNSMRLMMVKREHPMVGSYPDLIEFIAKLVCQLSVPKTIRQGFILRKTLRSVILKCVEIDN